MKSYSEECVDYKVLDEAVSLYQSLSEKHPHKIAVQKAAQAHNLDSDKLNNYIDHSEYESTV